MNVFKQAGFKIGDAFTVTSDYAHNFAIGSTVILESFGNYETMANFSCLGLSFTQVLTPDQVEPLASPAATILATLLPVPEVQPLTDTLLGQPLPYPLCLHFKAVDSIGELFETMPLAYVRQCIEQMPFSPFERAAMLALLETVEIN